MLAYITRRLFLIIPTLFGIMLINFLIVQLAPGGPIEQIIAQVQGTAVDATSRFSGASTDGQSLRQHENMKASSSASSSKYVGARGLDPEFIAELEKQFGFDKPLHERFFIMMKNYLHFDFGTSYFQDKDVMQLVLDKMPVSITLGLWTTLLTYLICIPLGIAKARKDGSTFDTVTSGAVILGYAIPSFLFAILLIIVFASGSYITCGSGGCFPLRGLTSENFDQLSIFGKIKDYLWHITLPVIALTIGSFATLTMLTKNSFLDEINKQYVQTARAKGLTERRVLYGHVFRNAMLIVIAGFPSAFIGILFTGSLLIEVIFSLDGLGLLGYEATLNRDYPVMFGTLFFFTFLGLIMNLISDILYTIIDPRIDFEARA